MGDRHAEIPPSDYYLKHDKLYRIRPLICYELEVFEHCSWHAIYGIVPEKESAISQLNRLYVFDHIDHSRISEVEGLRIEMEALITHSNSLNSPIESRIEELRQHISDCSENDESNSGKSEENETDGE